MQRHAVCHAVCHAVHVCAARTQVVRDARCNGACEFLAPRKCYIAGVHAAFLDAGAKSTGCKYVAQHFGAVFADEPRPLRSADYRGHAWTL